ncbi:MAG: SMC-Scp complex subunit ScpB [Candidatus Puniceispirillales bacterium]
MDQTILHYCRIIEALIFASPDAVTDKIIRQHLPDDATYDAVMEQLHSRFGEDSGINLIQFDGNWAMRTASDVAEHLKSIRESEKTLSRAALETLAIIVYHQPVTRAEIEEIRGVSISKGTLDILLEMGWVRPKGRRRTPGRPITWATSPGFLDHFGLNHISDLPGLDELKKTGLLSTGQTISDVMRANDLVDTEDEDEDQLELDELITEDDIAVDLAEEHEDD